MRSGLRALGGRLWMFMRSRLSQRMGIVETRRVFSDWRELPGQVLWCFTLPLAVLGALAGLTVGSL